MNRRTFLTAIVAMPLVSRANFLMGAETTRTDVAGEMEWRRFEITTRVHLADDSGASVLFLPLAQTASDYQAALALRWQSNGLIERVYDSRYGAPILRTTWKDGGKGAKETELVQTVATRNRSATPLLPLTEAERKFWTAPIVSAPVDGIILETAAKITVGENDRREQLRAIYDWVVEHTHRDPDTPGCGEGNIRRMLETGDLGGKCADINSLMVGMARAAGFPAREVYGLRVADSKIYPSLGRSGDLSKAQHCRAEVFLDEEGWFPVDPADVRKVILEEKIALDSTEGHALRERMFGHWEMNWVGYNSATDIVLPGSEKRQPNFPFLMYPCAFTEKGQMPCLNPAMFRYEITAREVIA